MFTTWIKHRRTIKSPHRSHSLTPLHFGLAVGYALSKRVRRQDGSQILASSGSISDCFVVKLNVGLSLPILSICILRGPRSMAGIHVGYGRPNLDCFTAIIEFNSIMPPQDLQAIVSIRPFGSMRIGRPKSRNVPTSVL